MIKEEKTTARLKGALPCAEGSPNSKPEAARWPDKPDPKDIRGRTWHRRKGTEFKSLTRNIAGAAATEKSRKAARTCGACLTTSGRTRPGRSAK